MDSKKVIKELLVNTPIRSIMTTYVYSVHVKAQLSKAEELFVAHNLTHLPVIDDYRRVVGLLSHMYVYKAVSPRRFVDAERSPTADMVLEGDSFYVKESLDRFILSNIMKPDPYVLNADEAITKAIHAMATKRLGCIPIVNEKKELSGILTNQDIIAFMAQFAL